MKRITKENYENIIYVSHEFQNNPENVVEIEIIIKKLQKEYPTYLFISPVHTFGFLYNEVSYEKGLDMSLFLLENCADEMWYVPSETSRGVSAEITYCQKFGIPYKEITTSIIESLKRSDN